MPVTDLSDVVASSTAASAQPIWGFKHARVNGAAAAAGVQGRYTSLWNYEGMPAAGFGGTIPTTSTVLSSSSAGALPLTNPAAGDLWLTGMSVNGGPVYGTFMLLDLMNISGGLSGTSTSAQTTNLPTAALTRYTSGVGVMGFVVVHTQIGSTATTATVSYTDDAGNASQTSPTFPIGGTGLRDVDRLIPIPLLAGDKGLRAIASITLAATTGTVGDFGLLLGVPLLQVSYAQTGSGEMKDLITAGSGPIQIQPSACLAIAYLAGSSAAPSPMFDLHIMET